MIIAVVIDMFGLPDFLSEETAMCSAEVNINPNVAKAGGLQSQGV